MTSAFYSFSPRMVAEHMESAWRTASPDQVLKARERAVDRAYRAIFGDRISTAPNSPQAASLARRAAEAANTAGRPLAAANAELAWPEAPHLQLWHAATILREHRGDGHLAALLVAGLDPVESLVSFAAIGAASVERFESRGWSPEEWAAARERLVGRGLLTEDGTATDAGRDLRREVEQHTDELAAAPWRALGPGRHRATRRSAGGVLGGGARLGAAAFGDDAGDREGVRGKAGERGPARAGSRRCSSRVPSPVLPRVLHPRLR